MSKRILIIDDECAIHTIVQVTLSLQSDWTLLTALTGQTGVAIAKAEQPDAILLDMMMPQQDGMATLKELQGCSKTAGIPVLFLTGGAQAADRRRLYKLGVKGVITKPFDPVTLVSQISGFLAWS